MPKSRREKDLAKIHIAKKELGLKDEHYRLVIESVMNALNVPGKPSSANLDARGRQKLLDTFKDMGWSPTDQGNSPEADHDRPHWRGRYESTERMGMATQKQCDYIALMEDELDWTPNPDRLKGFIERVRGKNCYPQSLSNRQASDVISAMEKMTGRKAGTVDAEPSTFQPSTFHRAPRPLRRAHTCQ